MSHIKPNPPVHYRIVLKDHLLPGVINDFSSACAAAEKISEDYTQKVTILKAVVTIETTPQKTIIRKLKED